MSMELKVKDKFYYDNRFAANEEADRLSKMGYGLMIQYDMFHARWITTITEVPYPADKEQAT